MILTILGLAITTSIQAEKASSFKRVLKIV